MRPLICRSLPGDSNHTGVVSLNEKSKDFNPRISDAQMQSPAGVKDEPLRTVSYSLPQPEKAADHEDATEKALDFMDRIL